jgi:precorrin-6B methylase 2
MSDRLYLANDFVVRVRSGVAVLEGPHGKATLPLSRTIELLLALGRPTTADALLAGIPAAGPADWVEAAAVLAELRRTGIVATEAASAARFGFASPALHASMLHDERRVDAFAAAIRGAVRPGDVVVDLGTGSGILATLAARAGARHVYAIEESAIADVAQRVFQDNGVDDRVTLLRGHSTKLDLPEKADVLVTETLGNDPLDEGILVWIDDARRRMLKPDARIVPRRIDVVGLAVDVTSDLPFVDEEAVADWRAAYGVDLTALAEAAKRNPRPHRLNDDELATMVPCSAAVLLESLDLATAVRAESTTSVPITLTRAARQLGVALGYDVDLGSNVTLRVGHHAGASHWRVPAFAPLARGSHAAGDTVVVTLTRTRTAYRATIA